MTDHLLDVRGLRKTFNLHARGKSLAVLHDVDVSVAPASIHVLSGPSGAGKSTVLRCCWRAYVPTDGEILYRRSDGSMCDLASCDEHDVLALRRDEIGFVTQFFRCVPRLACERVVAQPLFDAGYSEDQALERARQLLARLNISEALWSLPPATFSGGEQQRVNLARAFVHPRRLLLIDEPTASLDAKSAEVVVQLMMEAKQNHQTGMLVIVHDHDLSARIADAVTPVAVMEEQHVDGQ